MSFCEQRVIDKLPEFPGRGGLIALIMQRRETGLAKYGCSVDNAITIDDSFNECPLTEAEWLQHALEEHLDSAIYLQRAMETADNEASQMRWHLMQRMTLLHAMDLYQIIEAS